MKVIAKNKKAQREYFIEDKFEAGIVLVGTEVKSIRGGKVNLSDSHGKIINGELWLQSLHIAPYDLGNRFNHDPFRPRKLLIKKSEMRKLITKVKEKGYSLVPLELYLNDNGLVKILMALVRGKKMHDRRDDLNKKEAQREMERKFKDFNR